MRLAFVGIAVRAGYSSTREKPEHKGLDAIVANDVTAEGAGFGTETNRVTVISRGGPDRVLQGSKRAVAGEILSLLLVSPRG